MECRKLILNLFLRGFYKREKILKPQNYLPQYFNACMAFGREASETHEKFIRKLFS